MITTRRTFLTGLIAAPIVITTPGLLMPVKRVDTYIYPPLRVIELTRHVMDYDGNIIEYVFDPLHPTRRVYTPDQWRARSTLALQSL